MRTAARGPRGQNLVLLALTMLFLALMVTMTLGLGLRIRQKHELQNLADAAAYSNAVMEARSFNNMALINRLQVSYWVAMAADESLISWTGYARGMAAGTRLAILEARAQQACKDHRTEYDHLRETYSDIVQWGGTEYGGSDWNEMDKNAGKEALQIQGAIASLRLELTPSVVTPSPDSLVKRLEQYQKSQMITQQVIRASGLGDVDVLPNANDPQAANNPVGITRREVDCDFGAGGNGPLEDGDAPGAGLCLRSSWNWNLLHAAMGSRGNPFLTGRGLTPPRPQGEITRIASGHDVTVSFGNVRGSGYWGVGRERHGSDPTTTEAWGDDHGTVTVSTDHCSGSLDLTAHVRSTHLDNDDDAHSWTRDDDRGKADVRHTMGSCQPLCPSVWVRTIGFQPNDAPEDAFGQPKVVVALERDLSKRRFPWELNFSFPFAATGTTREWDGRGRQLHSGPVPGLDISRQVAWATAIIYYHRFQHWDEFPNLLNPFWRATLAPADVDSQGKNDVSSALRGPYRYQGQAYEELVRAGFKGLH